MKAARGCSASRKETERDDGGTRKTPRQRVLTEKGSDYRDSLRSARDSGGTGRRDDSQPGTSRSHMTQPEKTSNKNKRTGNMGKAVGGGHDAEVDLDSDSLSDDGVSDMVARAEAALSVITTVAQKLQQKKQSNRNKPPANKPREASESRERSRAPKRTVNSSNNVVFQRVHLFPEREDGEIVDDDDDDEDEVMRERDISRTARAACTRAFR